MPAIPMLLQWLIVAFFGADVLKKYGINATDVQNGTTGMAAVQAVPPVTPGATPAPTVNPTVKQITSDAVKNPVSLFGIAAVGFVGIFLISQARAGLHEATETTRELYAEGGRVTRAASGADGGPRNYSRRAKS